MRKSGRITIKADDKFDITPDLRYEYVQAIVDTDEEVLRVYHQDEAVKEFEYTL